MMNHWLFSNETNLKRIKRILIEMEYLPIFQDYPIRSIQGLFNGFEAEVNRLQNEVSELKNKNSNLKNELKKKDIDKDEGKDDPAV